MIDRIKTAEAGLGPQAEILREKALDLASAAREQWADGSKRVREFVVEHPAKAMGIALGMGVVFGWLIKRR